MKPRDDVDGRFLAIAGRYEPLVIAVALILVVLVVAPRVSSRRAASNDQVSTLSTRRDRRAAQESAAEAPSDAAAGVFFPLTPADSPFVPPVAPPREVATPTTTKPIEPVALRVAEAGWSGSDGGLPAAGADVPDGSLPVSSRLGEPDRRTYVRLTGTATVLVLAVTSDPVGSRFTDAAVIWLCPITGSGWHAKKAMAEADAPAYDCTTHGVGTAGPEQWSFDLSRFGAPSRPNGFALVAAPGAAEFQILFADRSRP